MALIWSGLVTATRLTTLHPNNTTTCYDFFAQANYHHHSHHYLHHHHLHHPFSPSSSSISPTLLPFIPFSASICFRILSVGSIPHFEELEIPSLIVARLFSILVTPTASILTIQTLLRTRSLAPYHELCCTKFFYTKQINNSPQKNILNLHFLNSPLAIHRPF